MTSNVARSTSSPMASPSFYRLTLPTIVVSFLLLGVSVGTGAYIHQMQRVTSAQLQQVILAGRAGRDVESALSTVRNRLNQYMLTSQEVYFDEARQAVTDAGTRLQEARSAIPDPAAQTLLNNMLPEMERLELNIASFDETKPGGDERLRELTLSPLTSPLIESAREVNLLMRGEVDRVTSENSALTNLLAGGLIVLGVCGAAAGLFSGITLARRINRAVVELNLSLRNTSGTLDSVLGPIKLERNMNLDALPASLQQMTARVTEVVAQLQESQVKMLRSEQLAAVGQLAAGLAHEMRNPLTAMRFIVQASSGRDDLSLTDRRNLQVLEEEILRLDQMVQMFLDFARPVELHRQEFPARDALERVAELMQPRATQQGVQILVDAPDEPLELWADPRQLHQVLINLVQNSLEVLESGGTIQLSARRDAPDGLSSNLPAPAHPWVMLEVADNGPGIDPEVVPRLFEPFVSTKDTGVGLGLSISKKIIETHGGTISLEPCAGGGARALLRLPGVKHPVAMPAGSAL